MSTLERFREEQAKLERAGSNASCASQSRPRRFSRLGLRPKAPPLSKTLDTVIREEAQHGHGVEHASKTYNQYVEHQRSCHNSRRNSADDLAVVEEGPEQQPGDKKVKKARSMGHVAPAAFACGRAEKKAERKMGESEVEPMFNDMDSGYVSQRGSHSLKEQASKVVRKLSPASSHYSQSPSLGPQQAFDVSAFTAVNSAASAASAAVACDTAVSCGGDAGGCCDGGAAG